MNGFDNLCGKIINEGGWTVPMSKVGGPTLEIEVTFEGQDDGSPAAELEYKGKRFGFWDIENPRILDVLQTPEDKQHSQVVNYLKRYLDKFIADNPDSLYVPKFGNLTKETPLS